MTHSKHINLTQAKKFAQSEYARTKTDQYIYLYIDPDSHQYDYLSEWDYRHGYGQSINENNVYSIVFYGTGGYNEPPAFSVENY